MNNAFLCKAQLGATSKFFTHSIKKKNPTLSYGKKEAIKCKMTLQEARTSMLKPSMDNPGQRRRQLALGCCRTVPVLCQALPALPQTAPESPNISPCSLQDSLARSQPGGAAHPSRPHQGTVLGTHLPSATPGHGAVPTQPCTAQPGQQLLGITLQSDTSITSGTLLIETVPESLLPDAETFLALTQSL